MRPQEKAARSLSAGFKLRGVSSATLLERFRSLSRRDMIFIAAGLSVLCLAPVAEQFLLAPGGETAGLSPGFDSRSPLFPDAAKVYEEGTGGLSPGNPAGLANDVVTPLNVRDPSALILGPGAQEAPAAGAPGGGTSGGGSDWKGAISQAASQGARAAAGAVKLPAPPAKMAGALRGLAAIAGSSAGPSFKLEPPSASRVPDRPGPSAALSSVRAAPGYRGAEPRALAAGGEEGLRAGGGRQADILNRGGAVHALDSAAGQAISGAGRGAAADGAGAGQGSGDKEAAATSAKDHRSLTVGQSLEHMRERMEMEREIDLKWRKKAWSELEFQKMTQEALVKSAIEGILGKGLFDPIGKRMADAIGGLGRGKPKTAPPSTENPARSGSAPRKVPTAG